MDGKHRCGRAVDRFWVSYGVLTVVESSVRSLSVRGSFSCCCEDIGGFGLLVFFSFLDMRLYFSVCFEIRFVLNMVSFYQVYFFVVFHVST